MSEVPPRPRAARGLLFTVFQALCLTAVVYFSLKLHFALERFDQNVELLVIPIFASSLGMLFAGYLRDVPNDDEDTWLKPR